MHFASSFMLLKTTAHLQDDLNARRMWDAFCNHENEWCRSCVYRVAQKSKPLWLLVIKSHKNPPLWL